MKNIPEGLFKLGGGGGGSVLSSSTSDCNSIFYFQILTTY